ncbi:preprotein translocase subunit SecY [[Clostridium] cellulosi]
MFETFRNALKIPDLRKKMLYTLLVIIAFRIGAAIPVPFLDLAKLKTVMQGSSNTLMGLLDTLTGGALSRATLFAMSVTPYINASIIIQLLAVAIPPLERLMKEGEVGRRKVAQITRYTTLGLGLLQGFAYYFYLRTSGVLVYDSGFAGVWAAIVIVASFTAGATLMMWLGERINDNGVGNGISILLFAGIISRGPAIAGTMQRYWTLGGKYYVLVPVVAILCIVVIAAIVFMNAAERRIPVQYAKRVVGRKMYGGQSTFIPIKVIMSGVMPIIFAVSIVSLPQMITMWTPPNSWWYKFYTTWLSSTSAIYAISYFILIILFNFFYVSIQYNPHEMANNLKKNNGGIPGIRPGKPTSDYIQRCLSRISFIGAIFLGIVAIAPIILATTAGMDISLGGTTLLIIVGVALDTAKQLESQMMMRHYKGFLE